MASQKNNLLIINLLIKKNYRECFLWIKEILLQMFISHKIKLKLPIKNEKDKSSLKLWDRRNIRNFTWTVSFRFFYSLSNSFQNNIPKNRHLSIGDENILKGYLVLITQMVALSLFYLLYHIFPVIKVRKFEFCIVIRSCLEPWNTQDDTTFTYSVSIHFKKVYSRSNIMLTCFILERLYLVSYIHSSVEKCFVFG